MMTTTTMMTSLVARLKRGSMSVEEELVSLSVPVHTTFSRITKQRVGKARQRAQLCLVALTADVDDHSLTTRRRTVVVVRQDLTNSVLQLVLFRRHGQRILVPMYTKNSNMKSL